LNRHRSDADRLIDEHIYSVARRVISGTTL